MSSPIKLISGVIFCLGLAAFGVLVWAARKGTLDRALDPGDVIFMSVFAIFGTFCVFTAWRLFRSAPGEAASTAAAPVAGAAAEQDTDAPPSKRVTLSSACSTAGVLLLVLAAVLPERWYPVAALFLGIALLAVSHALTPCEERIDKLRKMRASMRHQL